MIKYTSVAVQEKFSTTTTTIGSHYFSVVLADVLTSEPSVRATVANHHILIIKQY